MSTDLCEKKEERVTGELERDIQVDIQANRQICGGDKENERRHKRESEKLMERQKFRKVRLVVVCMLSVLLVMLNNNQHPYHI